MELIVMERFLDVAEAFLELALALVDLAADLGRPVAAELAGLFLDLAFGLVPLAFDLVVHAKPPWTHGAWADQSDGQMRCHASPVLDRSVSTMKRTRIGHDLTPNRVGLSSRG